MEIRDNWKVEDNSSEYVVIGESSISYCQNGDCTEDFDDIQTITISTRDNGVSKFLNIKTDNWSISDVDDLVALLEDAKKRLCVNYEEQDQEYKQN